VIRGVLQLRPRQKSSPKLQPAQNRP
jgi:hypothetical protein